MGTVSTSMQFVNDIARHSEDRFGKVTPKQNVISKYFNDINYTDLTYAAMQDKKNWNTYFPNLPNLGDSVDPNNYKRFKEMSQFEINEYYKNYVFRQVFENSTDPEDQEIWKNRKSLTRRQRDRLFAQKAMKEDLDGKTSQYEDPQLLDMYTVKGARIEGEKDDDNWGYNVNYVRGKARGYLTEESAREQAKYEELISNLSSTEREENIAKFDALSNDLSGYYNKYEGTDKLSLSDSDKLSLLAKYLADEETGGTQFANEELSRYYQDTVANNQSFSEKLVNTGAQFIDSAASMIFRLAGMTGGLVTAAFSEDDYWDHVMDNDVTRWADRIATTNSWIPEEQKELDAIGMSDNPILNTVAQEQSLVSLNTPLTLIGQYGFTAVSTALSFGTSAALKGLTTGVKMGTKLATAGKGLKATQAGAKIIDGMTKSDFVGQIMVPGILGGIEGSMNAVATKDATREALEEQISAVAYQRLLEDPNLAGNTPEEREYNARLLASDKEWLQKNYSDELAEAEELAKNAMYQDFWANSVINGFINSTAKVTLHAPRVQKSISRSRGKSKPNKKFDFSQDENGVWKAKAKKVKTKDIVKERFKESIGESFEEYLSELSGSFAEGYAVNSMEQYIDAKYNNGKVSDAVETDMWQAIGAGMRSMGETAFSEEALKSGLYGGLSTLLGGPNINSHMSWKKRKEGESFIEYASRVSPITWRGAATPLINHSERDARNKALKEQETRYNEFFSDKEVQRALFNVEGTASFLERLQDALQSGDGKAARDAQFGALYSTIATLQELEGSSYYDAVIASLNKRASFNPANLNNPESVESKAVDDFLGDVQNRDMEYTREEALERIIESSSEMLKMIDDSKKESRDVSKLFGDNLDSDVKASLVYNRLLIKKNKERMDNLDKELSSVTEAVNAESERSNVDKKTKELIVRYGSIENAIKQKDNLAKEMKETEKALKELEQSAKSDNISEKDREMLNRMINVLSGNLKDIEDQHLKLLEIELENDGRDLGVLTAADIMSLSATERAYMLDPENKNKYSAEQQAEINKVLSIGNNEYSDFAIKVRDRARLEEDYKGALRSQIDMEISKKSLAIHAYQAKKKATDRAYIKKNEKLLDLENQGDYEGFSKEFERILNGENKDEISAVRTMLSSSEFYKRYLQEKRKKDGIKEFVNSNDQINITSQQADVFSAMLDYLSANGIEATSIDEAVEALSEEVAEASIDSTGKTTLKNKRLKLQDYLDKINETLDDDKKVTIEDFGKSLQVFKDIIGAYNKDIEDRKKLSQRTNPAVEEDKEAAKPADSDDVLTDNDDTEGGKETHDYAEPIVNEIAKNNPNSPVIGQAEFIVGRIRSEEHRYGTDAVNMALKELAEEASDEFEDTDEFDAAVRRAENRLIASTEDDDSTESKAAKILKHARQSYEAEQKLQEERKKLQESANEPKSTRRSLFTRGSDKYIDVLSDEERAIQEARLSDIFNGKGVIPEMLSPETNAVITEHFARNPLIHSNNIRAWKKIPSEIEEFWKTNKIDEYLSSHTEELKGKKVYFISPDLGSLYETASDYDYTLDAPLIAVVEDPDGTMTIGDKKYQPIALMPRSYDGVHNRYYHRTSVKGTAHLLGIRKAAANVPRGELIRDDKGNVISSRITSFITGSTTTTSNGIRPAKDVNIDNFSESEKAEIKGKSKREIRGTAAYKKAKKNFINSFVMRGDVKHCFIRMVDGAGRPVAGADGLVRVELPTEEDFGQTEGRNSNATLQETLEMVLENDENYKALFDSSSLFNEGGFNRRTQAIGKAMQKFFKDTFKIEEIEKLPEKDRPVALRKLADALRREAFFVTNDEIKSGLKGQKRGIYFDANKYSFVFIPSTPINGKPGYTLAFKNDITDEVFPLAEVTEGTIDDKTIAKAMANLFMNGGQIRKGIRWQIQQNEINPFSENGSKRPNDISKEYLEEAYDDGLLKTTRTKVSVEVNQVIIQSPFDKNGNLTNPEPKKPTVVNKENADTNSINPRTVTTAQGTEVLPDTGTVINGKDERQTKRELNPEEEAAEEIVKILQEDSEGIELTEDENGYTHKNNPEVVYARTTSVIVADEDAEVDEEGKPKRFDNNSEWKTPSTLIGNSVDEFIRDFFDGKITDDFDFTSLPNASVDEWKALYINLKAFRDGYIKEKGLTIIPRDIVAHGTLDVTDKDGRKGTLNTAGTLDLFAYDTHGNLYIFDMKSYRTTLKGKTEKYARQVSVYKKLIEQRLAERGININIKGLSIIPINVSYPDAKEYDYAREKDGSNQLLIGSKGNKYLHKFRGARFRLGMPISVDYHEPKIKYEKLTDSEKALVKWRDEEQGLAPKDSPINTKQSITDTKAPEDTGGTEVKATTPEVDNTDTKPKEEPKEEPKESTSPAPLRPLRKSPIRGTGRRRTNIGGITEEQRKKLNSVPGSVENSLTWLKLNNPEGYKIAQKFNEDKKDDNAWDSLPNDVKDSYLSCL